MDSSTPKGSEEDWKGETGTTKTPKDKSCPYCGQAFTSSSLGRHLDLYIREKNPKPPDGIHDVDAIRKLRENITRRQPRGSARRETSTPAATPTTAVKRSPTASEAADESTSKSPAARKEGSQLRDEMSTTYPFKTPWEATGVIVDIPKLSGGEYGTVQEGSCAGDTSVAAGGPNHEPARTVLPAQRSVSKQVMKAQFDMKQKVQEALDTAKAAELALREFMSSWRAAKQQFDMNSTPFDFEPLALDFPALTLQCLQAPPTLFSSTQHPTSTSWSILPPGERQFEALRTWFADEFRKWKISCRAATTAVNEDLTYPPSQSAFKPEELREAIRKAEKTADDLETQVDEHIRTMFGVWDGLAPQRQQELWNLEMARAVGRKQKEAEELKESQHRLKQENANLKSQVEHLNRLQQPREYKLMSPMTIPMDQKLLAYMQEIGVSQKKRSVGFSIDGRHSDLNTVVTAAIDRWKNVIVAARSVGGLHAQRPLGTTSEIDSMPKPAAGSSSSNSTGATSTEGHNQTQQAQQPLHRTTTVQDSAQSLPTSTAVNDGSAKALVAPVPDAKGSFEAAPPSASTTGNANAPRSASADVSDNAEEEEEDEQEEEGGGENSDDEMSDADADGDAEMDEDDGFSSMNPQSGMSTPISKMSQEQLTRQHHTATSLSTYQGGQLEVTGTRAPQSHFAVNGPTNSRSVAQNSVHGARGTRGGMTTANRSLGNMQQAMQAHANQHHRMAVQAHYIHAKSAPTDMGMVPGIGDPMYMD